MAEKQEAVTLHEYLQGYEFTPDSGVKKDSKGRIVLTRAYCQNGHFLLSEEEKFENEPTIKLIGRISKKDEAIYLSPFMNDQRKKAPVYKPGTIVELLCPECLEQLKRLAPCGCVPGSFYRAVFLTPASDEDWSIGICDAYGCPRSFIRDGGEIVSEVRANMIRSMIDFGSQTG